MRIVISGGGGFLGRRLARSLLHRGNLLDADGRPQAIERVTLVDTARPELPVADDRLGVLVGDVASPAFAAQAIPADTDVLYHFAAVVSGGAEADFDLGMRVNLDGLRAALEAARRCTKPPRVIFTSSVAAFGGAMPEVIDDATALHPQSSYGVQKVIGEYLVGDYTRKGYVDGRAVRVPTVVVRPGKPNAAASSFASGILREPLAGVDAPCPVTPDTGMWITSPRRAIEAFIHAANTPASAWGTDRALNLPGLTVSVEQMVEALRRVAGDATAARVQWQPDPRVQAIVNTWPARFATPRALAMGFTADREMEGIIRDYMADEGLAWPHR